MLYDEIRIVIRLPADDAGKRADAEHVGGTAFHMDTKKNAGLFHIRKIYDGHSSRPLISEVV